MKNIKPIIGKQQPILFKRVWSMVGIAYVIIPMLLCRQKKVMRTFSVNQTKMNGGLRRLDKVFGLRACSQQAHWCRRKP